MAGTGQWSEGDPFTGVQSGSYWSSTTWAGNTSRAWRVFLGGGNVSSNVRRAHTTCGLFVAYKVSMPIYRICLSLVQKGS